MASVALAAGLLTAGLPAGPALASPAAAGSASYSFSVEIGGIKALGHVWSLDIGDNKYTGVNDVLDGIFAELVTGSVKGVLEQHEWYSTGAFGPTAAKDLTITSAGHATFKTGSALNPVLTATLAFTPTRQVKEACTKGSSTIYYGKLTGTLTLATGLRGVKVSVKLSGNTKDADLGVDKSCVAPAPPSKTLCVGGVWDVEEAPSLTPVVAVGGVETLAAKPTWLNTFDQVNGPTASKWLTRTDYLSASGPAPKLNTKARTVSVAGTASGPITGAAVFTYDTPNSPPPTPPCYVGSKRYSEKTIAYFGTSITVSRPFEAHMVTGTRTITASALNDFLADFIAVSLTPR